MFSAKLYGSTNSTVRQSENSKLDEGVAVRMPVLQNPHHRQNLSHLLVSCPFFVAHVLITRHRRSFFRPVTGTGLQRNTMRRSDTKWVRSLFQQHEAELSDLSLPESCETLGVAPTMWYLEPPQSPRRPQSVPGWTKDVEHFGVSKSQIPLR